MGETIQTNDEADVDITSVGEMLDVDTGLQNEILLPKHVTCFSHSLNLLATVDSIKALECDSAYKRLYRGALGKCTSLWNVTHRSSKAADAVKLVTAKVIIRPCATRWNSHFDAVKRILEIGPKLDEVCEVVGTPKFKPTEIECLQEYITVMEPIAVGLDKLQGQTDTYFGHIMPTLHTIQSKLRSMLHKSLRYSMPLLSALL